MKLQAANGVNIDHPSRKIWLTVHVDGRSALPGVQESDWGQHRWKPDQGCPVGKLFSPLCLTAPPASVSCTAFTFPRAPWTTEDWASELFSEILGGSSAVAGHTQSPGTSESEPKGQLGLLVPVALSMGKACRFVSGEEKSPLPTSGALKWSPMKCSCWYRNHTHVPWKQLHKQVI